MGEEEDSSSTPPHTRNWASHQVTPYMSLWPVIHWFFSGARESAGLSSDQKALSSGVPLSVLFSPKAKFTHRGSRYQSPGSQSGQAFSSSQ